VTLGIAGIAFHLPQAVLDNDALARDFPRFQPDKVKAKTGIERRHIAAADETAGDLAIAAGRKLLAEQGVAADTIDYLIFCTQAPDYFLPGTACLIHRQLGLKPEAGAIDINLGCSGFVYGLGLASGLIGSVQAARVLLLTADTYSKFIACDDLGTRTIFGDGAAATLIEARPGGRLGPFVYGTDGSGAEQLIVPTGASRDRGGGAGYDTHTASHATGTPLHMNGPAVFNFTIAAVPRALEQLLARSGYGRDDIDLFVFHQANATMLEALRRKLELPPERFLVDLEFGNTVSSTIPIALARAEAAGTLKPGMLVLLLGFGVGYSWAGTLLHWG
jgi:3-oxoacyl-[acyl-carrier-protein] synthase III